MPSGFLILPDGRCFSRQWSAHDAVLRAVADELSSEMATRPLQRWLLECLPGPADEAEIGHGAWFRTSDRRVIRRHLDLRQITPENQRAFCEAAKRATHGVHKEELLRDCLADLADMIVRWENGEPPLSRSDWRDVVPPKPGLIGPGWDAA